MLRVHAKLLLISLFFLVVFHTVALCQGRLFGDNSVLEFALSGEMQELLKDRGNDPQYHILSLTYKNDDGSIVTVPVKVKARGHFRKLKENCKYPPLLLNFSKESSENTVFNTQNKLKLVTPCQGDKYVVYEYLVYKLYNLISPMSFNARLVKMTFENLNGKGKNSEPLYGLLIEDETKMAQRNNTVAIDRTMVRPEQTQSKEFLSMAVFEYLIGNTDWSVQYRQNVKLIASDSLSRPYAVPYDFDHAGIVSAPYAKPAEQLLLTSTRERRYRGFCVQDMNYFNEVVTQFNDKKDDIYRLYTDNALLEAGYIKSTIKFLDDFYETINNPKKLTQEFQYPCRSDGTGNVVIMGLDKN
ncbi:MAG: hypothetical protein KBF45_07335 [Cyclobacteriaceae bacterium]|jgi:hypothetical protein|nr:hypothetical protein [Cyclobacteriaceae bacterium]